MIYKLLEAKHPLVHTKMPEFDNSEDFNRKEFSDDMVETMKHWGGIGLSANQVGFPYRMFIMGDHKDFISCWNPQILSEAEFEIPIDEGCLTYPGLFVKIYRPEDIYVQFEDDNKSIHNDTFKGLMCRIFQHEMDHMNGIDFTRRAKKIHLDMAKRKAKRGKLKLKRAHGKDMLKAAS